MRDDKTGVTSISIFATLVFTISFPANGLAAAETVLHQFNQQFHGNFANSVVADSQGSLYGTAIYGGGYNHGLVFQLTPNLNGNWTQTVLYSFTGGTDGGYPESGVTLDAAGNIYGSTHLGGTFGNGTVFELTPNGKGGWLETVLHSFAGGSDGEAPYLPPTVGPDGSVYGAATYGGASNYGIAFALRHSSQGWTEKLLFTFTGGSDGGYPGNLVLDKSGNLYGTAEVGGLGNGVVFELSPSTGGNWTEKVIYAFAGGSDGAEPINLKFNPQGKLFGTTFLGGTGSSCYTPNQGCGTLFQLTQSNGSWSKTTIYNFDNHQQSGVGIYPWIGTFDDSGNLFGTTNEGGSSGLCNNGCGTVFELSPSQGTYWKEAEYDFSAGYDGYSPAPGVVFGLNGLLYGSTSIGGSTLLNGTIFALQPPTSGQWTLTNLYNFPYSDGAAPASTMVADGLGNFYGTTGFGGTYDLGTVFKLTPAGKGTWKENIIYSFNSGRLTGVNGSSPSTLISDWAGNFYGTTGYGGGPEFGSVFELSPTAGGGWTESDLHVFGTVAYPLAGLVFDNSGNLYGTTSQGASQGHLGHGMVFELSPGAGGAWTYNVIYNFQGYPADGDYAAAALIRDASGNLYGTTQKGGSSANCIGPGGKPIGCGTVFELSLVAGKWTEKVLYSFMGASTDGANPEASLIFDSAGNLYGTTAHGGTGTECSVNGLPTCGTVFELSPTAGGWSEKVLYEFTNTNGDGGVPIAGLLFDQSGNLYGTTSQGGTYWQKLGFAPGGTVFELSPDSGSGWTETILHNFGNAYDGQYPAANLVFDGAGNLYGTTVSGGQANTGTLFEITF